MKYAVVLLSFAMLASPSFGQTIQRRSGYIGFTHPGVIPENALPNGVKYIGGGLIGDVNADPVYGISMVSKGKIKMLWLEVSTGQNGGGVTGWHVKDVLSFYNQRAYDQLFIAGDPTIECHRKGKPLENVAGIGRIVPKTGIFRLSSIWFVNTKKEKFDRISTAGIKCVYSEP